jgi:hypothetical protein
MAPPPPRGEPETARVAPHSRRHGGIGRWVGFRGRGGDQGSKGKRKEEWSGVVWARRGGDGILNSDGGGEGKWAGETLRVVGLWAFRFVARIYDWAFCVPGSQWVGGLQHRRREHRAKLILD